MMANYFFLALGIVLLYGGGELLVNSSLIIAKKLNLSNLFIGVVLVGFGTSLPELLVSVEAALTNNTGVVIGNVVGSNISNLLLILGVSGLIHPFKVRHLPFIREGLVGIMASLVLLVGVYTQVISSFAGLFMVLSLFIYFSWSYIVDYKKNNSHPVQQLSEDSKHNAAVLPKYLRLFFFVLLCILGLTLLLIGADLLIKSAVIIARQVNISEEVIGLSLVALSTSLPELSTSIVAAFKKKSAVLIGNIFGSNLFNILGVLGVSAMLRDIPIVGRVAFLDIPLVFAISILTLLLLFLLKKMGRIFGGGLVCSYFVYILFMYI